MVFHYEPGVAFGDYILERRLGGGGFGDVWLARDAAGEQVALKLLAGRYSTADAFKLRAEVELLAASAASSSHIVTVLGGGLEPAPYVVMEYVEGTDLASEIERAGTLPVAQVVTVARGVLEALEVLEHAGIIHRDVKPANVMLDSAGVVKLTDFGIAKIVGFDSITATSQAPLSMAYAAPEVWEGHATHQSDLYACGSLLYQCLAGRPAFVGTHTEVFRHHLVTPPDLSLLPDGVPAALLELILRCMEKEPKARPTDAAAALLLVEKAEAEMTAHLPRRASAGPRDREPRAFGPWVPDSLHPTQPWAFICANPDTGQKATVEIHFSDEVAFGERLRRAVLANPRLVAFGAERLFGTNRLILRPDEAWAEPPSGRFQFWVARDELPASAPPENVSAAERTRISAALESLIGAAKAEDVYLRLSGGNLSLLHGGSIQVRRPGLPPFVETDTAADAAAFLGSLPADQGQEATRLVRRSDLRQDEATSRQPETETTFYPRRPAPAERLDETMLAPRALERAMESPPRLPEPNTRLGAPTTLEQTKPRLNRKLVVAGGFALIALLVVAGIAALSGAGGGDRGSTAASFISRGELAFNSKKYDDALVEYNKALELEPKNATAYTDRGRVYLAQIKDELALVEFNKAIEVDPTYAYAYNSRGVVYAHQNKTDLALADFKKATELDPKDARTYVNRGNFYRAQAQADLALADYNKAIDLDPQKALSFNARGNIPYDAKRYDEAFVDYDKAIALDPTFALAYSNRGYVYAAQNKPDLALADFSKAIQLEPSARSYNGRGNVYDSQSKPELALVEYNKAIDLDPMFGVAYSNRGYLYASQNKPDLALADFSKAIQLEPSARSYNGRGNVYDSQSKPELALVEYSKAIELDPTFALAYSNRGYVYATQNKPDLALADFSKAIQLDAKSARLFISRGNIYGAQGKPDLALSDYDKAIELDPKNFIAYNNRGVNHFNAKRYPEAIIEFSKAIELNLNYVSAYLNRGNVYRAQNRIDLARADYEKAKSVATTPEETQRAQGLLDSVR